MDSNDVAKEHMVFVVDDDHRMREALQELFTSLGLTAVVFPCAADYLAFAKPDVPSCLILDLQLPDTNGLDLQKQIAEGDYPPVIFITGHGDIPTSIFSAIARDGQARRERASVSVLRQRFSCLTAREREVLPLVVSGLLNKQAAVELGISEITLQIHRSKIMHKMAAESLPELVRMAGTLNVPLTHSRRALRGPARFAPDATR